MTIKSVSIFQAGNNSTELLQRVFKVLCYLPCYDIRIRQVIGVFKAFITQPEDVKVHLVSLHKLIKREGVETIRLIPFKNIGSVVAGDEIFEVFIAQGVGLEREVCISA